MADKTTRGREIEVLNSPSESDSESEINVPLTRSKQRMIDEAKEKQNVSVKEPEETEVVPGTSQAGAEIPAQTEVRQETGTTNIQATDFAVMLQRILVSNEDLKQDLKKDIGSLKQGVGSLKQDVGFLKDKIEQNNREMTEKVKKQSDEIKTFLNVTLNNFRTEVNSKVELKFNELKTDINEQVGSVQKLCDQHIGKLADKLENTEQQIDRLNLQQVNVQENIETVKTDLVVMHEELNLVKDNSSSTVEDHFKKYDSHFQEVIFNLQSEIEEVRNKPIVWSTAVDYQHKDIPRMQDFRRNPIVFFNRLTEHLAYTRTTQWSGVRRVLDICFNGIHDQWWAANREVIADFPSFEESFKSKYWSESIQHIVRDDLENGTYKRGGNLSLTAYFLGKVCIAKHLVPAIPEACLVAKLSYHYGEDIRRARTCGQIKTINDMERLLGDFENESYYRTRRHSFEDKRKRNDHKVNAVLSSPEFRERGYNNSYDGYNRNNVNNSTNEGRGFSRGDRYQGNGNAQHRNQDGRWNVPRAYSKGDNRNRPSEGERFNRSRSHSPEYRNRDQGGMRSRKNWLPREEWEKLQKERWGSKLSHSGNKSKNEEHSGRAENKVTKSEN
jgi:hypothetical protein